MLIVLFVMARQLIKDGPAPSPAVISRRCFRIEATFCVWNVQSCTQLSSLSCFFKLMYSWRAIKKKRACNLDCQKKKIIYSVYHNFSLIVGSDNSFSIKYVIFDREMNSAKEDMFHSIECCDASIIYILNRIDFLFLFSRTTRAIIT